jgi:hypothetical protein
MGGVSASACTIKMLLRAVKSLHKFKKPLTRLTMYLEEHLLSVKTCRALQKTECLHLQAFCFLNCSAFFPVIPGRYPLGIMGKVFF